MISDAEVETQKLAHDTLNNYTDNSKDDIDQDYDDDIFLGEDKLDEIDRTLFPTLPENYWYHGKLSRWIAEQRLWEVFKTGKVNCFLVRKSDYNLGSYAISHLGFIKINHFKVTAVCGNYYLGGRCFNSLSDLIGYCIHYPEMLKGYRLENPVPPPEPVNDKKRVVAIFSYTKSPETDELTFRRSDVFYLHNTMKNGWLWVTAQKTGEQGIIFEAFVEYLDEEIDSNVVFDWFHPSITLNETHNMLEKSGPGSFLVSPSDDSFGNYTLFFHVNNKIQKFQIQKKCDNYLMYERTFESLDAIINTYCKEQIFEGYRLVVPVICKSNKYFGTSFRVRKNRHLEKAYMMLEESQKQAELKKKKQIKIQGYMYKKSNKNNKWKLLYFILFTEEAEKCLCFYDNPKKIKPKGLIDLNCVHLYPVHESVFDRTNCFQLVEKVSITYLSTTTLDLFQEWVSAIRIFSIIQLPRVTNVQKLRELRCLQLYIRDIRDLSIKCLSNPYCIIYFNEIKVARFHIKHESYFVIDEELTFDDVPLNVFTFTIRIYNKGKKFNDTKVAELTVDLEKIKKHNAVDIEESYPLSVKTSADEFGSLRLRTRYLHDLIMPIKEYSSMEQLILGTDLEAIQALADLCHQDHMLLVTSIMGIFKHEQKEIDLLKSLNDIEIMTENDANTLFRATSFTTNLMTIYMKSICSEFLKFTIEPTIIKLLESKQSCELVPSKMKSPDDAKENLKFLLSVLDEITESIFSSVDACPRTLRYICGCLQKMVMKKWPNDKLIKTHVVSSFIFLRLLCPAILNPRQFNLIPVPPSPMATRSLIMVVKCLQNLANLVEFGTKAPYMTVVNLFILKNKERMIEFIDQLSNVTDIPEMKREKIISDLARNFGILHYICNNHLVDLQNLSKSHPTLGKIVRVTQMLNERKNKYREMFL